MANEDAAAAEPSGPKQGFDCTPFAIFKCMYAGTLLIFSALNVENRHLIYSCLSCVQSEGFFNTVWVCKNRWWFQCVIPSFLWFSWWGSFSHARPICHLVCIRRLHLWCFGHWFGCSWLRWPVFNGGTASCKPGTLQGVSPNHLQLHQSQMECIVTIFLQTGVAMMLSAAQIGQLAAQCNASHMMLDYINNYFMMFTHYVSLGIEFTNFFMLHCDQVGWPSTHFSWAFADSWAECFLRRSMFDVRWYLDLCDCC